MNGKSGEKAKVGLRQGAKAATPGEVEIASVSAAPVARATIKSVTSWNISNVSSENPDEELIDVEVQVHVPPATSAIDFSKLRVLDGRGKKFKPTGFGPDGRSIYYPLDKGLAVVERGVTDGFSDLIVVSFQTARLGQLKYLDQKGATADVRMHLLFQVPKIMTSLHLISEAVAPAKEK